LFSTATRLVRFFPDFDHQLFHAVPVVPADLALEKELHSTSVIDVSGLPDFQRWWKEPAGTDEDGTALEL
jgi:hypothetical protein